MTSKDKDDDSIGSDTFREQRRQAYEETCETDEQLFNQHNNIQSIFDNRHHDLNFVDDDDGTGGSSLGGYSNLDDNASKGSIRTRDELRMSLIARRRRLAQMESAMDGEGSLNMSLKLNRRDDGASLMSSLVDSMISLNDSIQGSLLSKKKKKKKKKTSKSSSNDVKKKSMKKKSKSKEKQREKKKVKHKRKEKEKRRNSKMDKKKKKSSKGYESSSESSSSTSSSSSSSESESEQKEEYSKRTKCMPQNATKRQGGDKHRMRREHETNGMVAASRADNGRVKSVMAGGEKSVQTLDHMQRQTQVKPSSSHSMDKPSRNAEVAYNGEMCAYHPDIRMRKKSALGGGWRIVLKSCPKCAGHTRKRESGGDMGDRSVRSRGSTRQQGDRQLPGSIDRIHRPVSSSSVRGQSDRQGSGGLDTSNRSGKRSGVFSRQSDRRGSGGIDGSHPSVRSSAATTCQLDTRERPPDRGIHRQAPLQVAPSQRQHSYRHVAIESNAKSSTSSVARPKPTMEQRPTSRRGEIHSRPSRGESVPPPINSLPPQPRQTQRGASNPTQRDVHATPQAGSIKPVARSRSQQPTGIPHRSSRHSAYLDISPGSGKEPSLVKSQSTLLAGTNKPISSQPESVPTLSQNVDGKSGHGRSPSLQRMINVVNFDPPVDRPGSSSDHAVRRSGGTAYDGNQASSTFIEELDDVKPNTRSQQSRSKTLPNLPHKRRMSLSCNGLDSLSAKDLMNFVLAESAHFDKNSENWGDLQRALMEQVRRLSLGSVGGDISDRDTEDQKFSVLREVVKSYMISQNNVNSDDRDYGHTATVGIESKQEHHAYKFGDEGRRRDMIKVDNQDDALKRIASLKPGDPAFIRRTTGKWTYAKVKDVASDSIAFIVDVKGSLKSYKVKYWVSHVRTLKV